ncbi:PadR family transcriptional regulator [uncultured Anaerococcus sp.]|uniref:PadR family transcriptional regulator n=1 Tax=uncultured Anaerococcus sp. TaxID=293428 RepID=UPI00288960BA|nr:PadR family transcriptional regulator [uncultured Anaerococcus sp.]
MARDQFQTLTEPMYFTLLALGEVRNGAEITSWVEEITKGRIRLAPGTLYALLAQFLENNLIKRVETDQKGKHYIITDEGIELLKYEVQRLRFLISNYENHFEK